MPYEYELKLRAVKAYRDGPRSLASVASDFGIARSTLARWDEQIAQSEAATSPSPFDAELLDVVTRLGLDADDGVKAFALGAKNMKHVVWTVRIVAAVGAVLLALPLIISFWYFLLSLHDAILYMNDFILWLALTTVILVFGLLIATLFDFFRRTLAPFPYAVSQLHSAEAALMMLEGRDVFRVSPFNLRRRIQRRRIKVAMSRAERKLASRTRMGHTLRSPEARNVEVTHRRNVAKSLAMAELQLHREGAGAYPAVTKLLRTVMILTVLKDWSLPDLVPPPGSTHSYDSWPSRIARFLRNAVSGSLALAGVVNWILATPDIPGQLEKLGVTGESLTSFPWL